MRDGANTFRVFELVSALIFTVPWTPAFGQGQRPLSQTLPDLVLREIVLDSPSGALPGGATHTAHFSPIQAGELTNPAVGVVASFNSQMATQFATFPLGSSAGGLTYEFDPTVGTLRRGSASFGPLFAERALTIGRRKLSAGFNYQRTSYSTFEGQNLADGSIKIYLQHQDCCHLTDPGRGTGFTPTPLTGSDRLNPPFKGDLVEAALSIKATTDTAAIFANYGLTNHWDVGLAIPFVRVSLDASVRARIVRVVTDPRVTHPDFSCGDDKQCQDTIQGASNVHTFEQGNPNATQTVRRSGHAAGLGDIVLRTKYRFLRRGGGGLAAAIDLRVPTGDADELLGAGGAQAKFLLIASSERGRLGQHVNIGYTAASGRVGGTLAGLTPAALPDELNYAGGVEFVAHRRLTVVGDVVGRTLRGAGRLDLVSKGFPYNEPTPLFPGVPPGPGCGGFVGFTCKTASFPEFSPRAGDLRLLLGTGGVKYNVAGNLLISASVLLPMTSAGLRSRVTTMIGLDYVVR